MKKSENVPYMKFWANIVTTKTIALMIIRFLTTKGSPGR